MKKFLMTAVAFSFLVLGGTTASAQSLADILASLGLSQTEIAVVMAAQGGSSVNAGGASMLSAHNGVNLQVGSRGARVMELQRCMNSAGFTSGPVDGVFGPMTASAVRSFQATQGLAVDGIVGMNTTPAFQAACPSAPVVVEVDEDEDSSEDRFDRNDGEEASLEDFDLSSEDDAEEGEMMHVATIEFDVEDGDFLMERLDLDFEFAGAPNADDEPWDVFENLALAVDGDVFAEEDIDDEDDWQDEDGPVFSFRMNGLDLVIEENDTAEIEVWLTAQDNVDDAANASWTILVDDEGVRGVDTAGITQYIGDEAQDVTFDVEEEGGDEAIEIQSSSDDPDEATLIVDNDDESDWMEVFVFELESEDNDIDIDEIVLTVDLGTEDYDDVVNDARLVVDGQEFDDFDITNGNSTTATLTFDIDDELTVDGDESVDVVLELEFKDTNDQVRYVNGETVQAATVSVDGEGADDVSDNNVITGSLHTLYAEGLVDSYEDKTSEARDLGDDTIAVFTFELELEAIEDTFYIAEDQGIGAEANGFGVSVSAGTITDVTISSTSADLVNAGTAYEINEGSSESFTVEITVVSGAGAGVAQAVRATIDDVTYDTSAGLAGDDETLILGAPDYRSGTVTVIDVV